MPAGVHPDPGGELGGHVQDRLAVGDQPLGQGPARAVAAFHRPPAMLPPAGEARQAPIAHITVGEPGRPGQGLGHRAGTAAVLPAFADQQRSSRHRSLTLSSSRTDLTRRAVQLPAAQTSLEPHPRRRARDGPRAVREPEQPLPRGDGSRLTSEPVPAQRPEDHTSTGLQQRSKQVADSACLPRCLSLASAFADCPLCVYPVIRV